MVGILQQSQSSYSFPNSHQIGTKYMLETYGVVLGWIIQATIFYLCPPESCDYIIMQNIFSPTLKVPGVFSLNTLKFPCKLKKQTGSHTQGHRIYINIPKPKP